MVSESELCLAGYASQAIGCRTKELMFFMGSKGNGKHFVGLLAFECFRTAPPVRDCANGFGIRTMPRRLCLAGYIGCRTKELMFFMGSKGNGKHFVGLHFAWHGLESCCCLNVSKALRQKHLLQRFCRALYHLAWTRLFRNCASQGFTWHAVACGGVRVLRNCASSKGDCANGFGIGTMPRRLCLAGYRVPDKRFLWAPKVTGSILSGCILLGMGSNPAAVSVFRRRFGKSTSCNGFQRFLMLEIL